MITQEDKIQMLAATAKLRGSIEETADLVLKIEAARRHFSQIADDLMYQCQVLKERTDLQRRALQLLEQEVVASKC